MQHTLEREIEVPVPLENVFGFFGDAANLQKITPPELHFQIITPCPIEMKEGALIQYRLGLFGIPFGWTTRISRWDPPHSFVDEQLKGPYSVWVHTHTFSATTTGTLVKDHVLYQLPFSPLGDVTLPVVRQQLNRIFNYREQAVRDTFMGPGVSP